MVLVAVAVAVIVALGALVALALVLVIVVVPVAVAVPLPVLAVHHVGDVVSVAAPVHRDLRRHTSDSNHYARWATTDGRLIVFQRAGAVFRYDPRTGVEEQVDIDVRPTRRRSRPRT